MDTRHMPRPGTQSIERALMLIREIAYANRTGIRLIDLAEVLPIERTTIHRLLKPLLDEQIITKDRYSRRYFLGEGLFELGLTAGQHFNPRDLCQPILSRIAEETEDTVFLIFRTGLELVCVDRKDGSFPIKVFSMKVGDRRPLGDGASGLAILSSLPEEEAGAILKKMHPRKKGKWATQILAEVRQTQIDGYSMRENEVTGVRSVAVPIRGRDGKPFAALSFVAIKSRVDNTRLPTIVKTLKKGAQELEQIINKDDIAKWHL